MPSAMSLYRYVGTPITSAASSSSWIANRPVPSRAFAMTYASRIVTSASTSIIT